MARPRGGIAAQAGGTCACAAAGVADSIYSSATTISEHQQLGFGIAGSIMHGAVHVIKIQKACTPLYNYN